MPVVVAKRDNLDEQSAGFVQRALTTPVFLNSVPKCGTHLIRNIFRMFVPVVAQYHDAFVQIPILHQHRAAFSGQSPRLSWGHLLFSDDSAIALRHVRHVLIVRDPYDWVLARARFFLSDTFRGELDHLKGGKVSAEQMISMMIFGIYQKAPTMQEIFTHNAVAWLGNDVKLVRYEDLLHHVMHVDKGAAQDYFEDLFAYCNMGPLPEDWRERVRIGSDRKQSATARENLAGAAAELPTELSLLHKQMVDYAAPGLRALLGYR